MSARNVAATANHFVDFDQGEWWQLPLSDAVTQVWPLMQLQLAPLTAAQGLFDQSSHVCMYIEHCYDCKCVCRVMLCAVDFFSRASGRTHQLQGTTRRIMKGGQRR